MSAYIVTLAAKATVRVWVKEAATANEARLIAQMGDGEEMAPWAPETKPQVRRVERA